MDLPTESAAAELAQRPDADLIAGALASLTAQQQQVTVMKFIEGLSNDQIAAIMGKREGAIRVLQMRALLRLRRVLKGAGRRAAGDPARRVHHPGVLGAEQG